MEIPPERELAYLLEFDGARYFFDEGYWVKIEVKRVALSPRRPHGLSYSLTLHDPAGTRLLGYDNAHAAPSGVGGYAVAPVAHDHWHRTESDAGRPYAFVSAWRLLQDFFEAAERILRERGVASIAHEGKAGEGSGSEDSELGEIQE